MLFDVFLNVENRIGSEEMQELKELANNEKRNPKHWTIAEVLEIKKTKQKIRIYLLQI